MHDGATPFSLSFVRLGETGGSCVTTVQPADARAEGGDARAHRERESENHWHFFPTTTCRGLLAWLLRACCLVAGFGGTLTVVLDCIATTAARVALMGRGRTTVALTQTPPVATIICTAAHAVTLCAI